MIELTPSQNKTVAAGATILAVAVVIAFVACVGWGIMQFLKLISPAITPVILGVFLSMFFKPYFMWWRVRVKNPSLALAAMLATVLVPFGLMVWLGGSFLVDQIAALCKAAPTIVERFSSWTNSTFPKAYEMLAGIGMTNDQLLFFTDPHAFSQDLIAQLSSAYGADAVKAGMGALKYLATIGTGLVALVFFAFFLMRPDMRGIDYARQLPFLKDETRAFVATQIDTFLDILVSFFQRQVLICLIEGVLYGIGFVLVGLPYGFVIGFLLGSLNLVPLFGTVVCLPMALPLAFFGDGGSGLRLIGVLCVWATGQILDGYLITPVIQGNKTGLGFAGVVFSFIFWGVVFHSMLGLLLAIPLSAFCVVLWRSVKRRYVKGVI